MDNIDNTEAAWGEALLKLAEEAKSDAAQRDSGLVLAQTLDDLSRVLVSYASRLGVEKLPERAVGIAEDLLGGPDELSERDQAVLENIERLTTPPTLPWSTALEARLAALEARPAPEPFDLPGWVRETLQSHHERISALEALVGDLVEMVEANANRTEVTLSAPFTPEAPLDPDDFNPEAWGSIDRAREALSRRVWREHKKRAALRQTVLNDVIALSSLEELSDDDEARLRQHRERAEVLSQNDIVVGVKLDQIAALDSLDDARIYDPAAGWAE